MSEVNAGRKTGAMAPKSKVKASTAARRQALVVAGMHRSGTSAMARLLSLVGGALPERVMDPGPDNPLGYWEPWEMVALDDAILRSIGSRWDNVFAVTDNDRAFAIRDQFLDQAKAFLNLNFGDQDLLVMKDPRSSILTRFWRQALDEINVDPVYVIMVRHPFEVAESLKARAGTSRETALLLWTSYMLAVERDTRGAPRIFVDYGDLLGDWRGVLDRIEAVMGRSLPNRTPEATAEVETFLSKSHRHHEADAEALEQAGVWPGAAKTYAWLVAAARGASPSTAPLAKVEAEIAALERAIGFALVDMRRELDQLPAAKAEAAQAREAEARATFLLEDVRREAAATQDYLARFRVEVDEAIAQWGREVESERVKVEILREGLAQKDAEAVILAAEVAAARAETQALMDSTSWKITRPLRALIARLRR